MMVVFLLYSSFSFSKSSDFMVGVGIHPTSYSLDSTQLTELLKKYKIQITRYDYPWSQVELKKGIYTVPNKKLDELVTIADSNNIETILILGSKNKLYGDERPVTEEERQAFANYAAWVAERFKGKKVIYEIWNEWPYGAKNQNFDPAGKLSAQLYVKLVASASTAILAKDPGAKIIAGSLNPLNKGYSSWTDNIFKLNILKYINGFSIHPYNYQNDTIAQPQYNIDVLDALQDRLKKITGVSTYIPFYVTEFGYPDYNGGVYFSPSQRKEFIENYFVSLSQKPFVKSALWYDFINDGDDKNIKEFNFGLLDSSYHEKSDMIGFLSAINIIQQNINNGN